MAGTNFTDEAGKRAKASFNPCVTCINIIIKLAREHALHTVPMCCFLVDDDRAYQSRKVYVEQQVVQPNKASSILRCQRCYNGGRDCYQVPKKLVSKTEAIVHKILQHKEAGREDVVYLDRNAEVREAADEISEDLFLLEEQLFKLTKGVYAQKALTPLHAGYSDFRDTRVLGLTEKQKNKRKAERDEEESPAKRHKGEGYSMALIEMQAKISASEDKVATLVDDLEATGHTATDAEELSTKVAGRLRALRGEFDQAKRDIDSLCKANILRRNQVKYLAEYIHEGIEGTPEKKAFKDGLNGLSNGAPLI